MINIYLGLSQAEYGFWLSSDKGSKTTVETHDFIYFIGWAFWFTLFSIFLLQTFVICQICSFYWMLNDFTTWNCWFYICWRLFTFIISHQCSFIIKSLHFIWSCILQLSSIRLLLIHWGSWSNDFTSDIVLRLIS